MLGIHALKNLLFKSLSHAEGNVVKLDLKAQFVSLSFCKKPSIFPLTHVHVCAKWQNVWTKMAQAHFKVQAQVKPLLLLQYL